MFDSLPKSVDSIRKWTWDEHIKPYYDDLLGRELTPDSIEAWMADWNKISDLLSENFSRVRVATTQDTTDEEAESYFKHLRATIFPPQTRATNELQKKLVASGLKPANFDLPFKKMQNDIALFREENIDLMNMEQALTLEHAKITGAQTVQWEGEERTLQQMSKLQEEHDRDLREKAWLLTMERSLQDRQALNELWTKLFDVRQKISRNAGFENYRTYRWQFLNRLDYTPEDCETFHNAIEEVVIPAARRRYEHRRQQLGLDALRPWDLAVDPEGNEGIRPYETIEEFAEKAGAIFTKVDPKLGEYYATMRQEDLFDLPNRKNKRGGAYCTRFAAVKRPFVFMNAVGTRGDVRTLLHEMGHAFHGFEVFANLPYGLQQQYPIEFAEVASMAMELLAAPYLTQEQGGYFSAEDAARDRIGHLEKILFFWPYMAVVDAFQHWAYGGGDEARDPAACDAKWAELWGRFMGGVDWSGLEDDVMTGWHRKQHIYHYPFYYVEYGLAQLGAVQVWANALDNQSEAVAAYLRGLALGGTKSLPELFGTAGAKFAFDAETLGSAVDLIERTIDELEA